MHRKQLAISMPTLPVCIILSAEETLRTQKNSLHSDGWHPTSQVDFLAEPTVNFLLSSSEFPSKKLIELGLFLKENKEPVNAVSSVEFSNAIFKIAKLYE
jgi:hypothetical protein